MIRDFKKLSNTQFILTKIPSVVGANEYNFLQAIRETLA